MHKLVGSYSLTTNKKNIYVLTVNKIIVMYIIALYYTLYSEVLNREWTSFISFNLISY